ncbi:tetratricopeptide repeat protein [Streptomyces sp. XM83C]|uniref:AfsR/SARP family transcriptional regulator n=1 Tax=Streptomyces TaxID=1883 RepID=UPI001FF95B4D|nr:AfsR/SARP family transcriptional regulator [Streptomyces sp. XM83C]MCK1822297.1 tetratricopeptide repeat protein [Streptomyces sp. XM83C]
MEVAGPDGTVLITAERQRIILALLLMEANRVVPTERLVDAVWGDEPPSTARGQIQICVSMVRSNLAKVGLKDVIRTQAPGYVAEVADDDLDLRVFDRLALAGRAAAEAGDHAAATAAFAEALALWRGDLHIDSGADRTTLQGPTARLNEQRLAVVEQWVDSQLALGLHQQLVEQLMDLVVQNPLREHLRAQLMLALYRSGRQAEALEAYRNGRQVLIDELGIEPGEELRRLEEAILSGELDSAAPPAPPAARPAAPGPVSGPPVVPRLLPGTIADFTGRDSLVASLRAGLDTDADTHGLRIVSITGKGGVGKTTLAVHVAQLLAKRFPDGQLFAKLRGPASQPVPPGQILERFLRGFGIPGGAIPAGLEERAELFRNQVAGRRVLIVLDDAVDEAQVRWLLPGSPSCPVMVTSRSRLTGLEGTHGVQVDVFTTEQALQMLDRILGADRVRADLPRALELVDLCGGLALALRVAAARLAARPHWTLGHMVARLHDERRRLNELSHGGMGVRSSLALAYHGLPSEAQRLFRRLSMLEATEFSSWVAAPLLDLDVSTAEDTLELLVDAQLVDVELVDGRHARYRMHDLVRVYAQECLSDAESTPQRSAVLERVLSTWLYLLEEAHRRVYLGDHALHGEAVRRPLDAWVVDRELRDPMGWFDAERTSLITAVRQAAAAGLDELCWCLALTLVTMFENYNYFDDWRTTHEIALEVTRRNGNRRGQAAMLYSLGSLHMFEYRLDEARSRLEAACDLFQSVGDRHGQALAIRNLALADQVQGRSEQAMSGYEHALAMLDETDDPTTEAHVLNNMAQIHLEQGRMAEARGSLQRALVVLERSGGFRIRAQILCRLGEAHLETGDLAAAEEAFGRAMESIRAVGDPVGEVYALRGLAVTRQRQGAYEEAAGMLERAMDIAERAQERLAVGRIRLALGELAAERGDSARASEHLTRALRVFEGVNATKWRDRARHVLQRLTAEPVA